MKISLNCEEFYNDICESIRSFYPEETIVLGQGGDLQANVQVCDNIKI